MNNIKTLEKAVKTFKELYIDKINLFQEEDCYNYGKQMSMFVRFLKNNTELEFLEKKDDEFPSNELKIKGYNREKMIIFIKTNMLFLIGRDSYIHSCETDILIKKDGTIEFYIEEW